MLTGTISITEAVQKGIMLPLMEEFYTIQGEGSHAGRAAYFIRVGGCDVGCHFCDVKESWDFDRYPPKSIEKMADNASRYSKLAIITGGEPLVYNMEPLTRALKQRGIKVHIETCGAYPLTGQWDWICLSPKKQKLPLENVYEQAHELKMVIFNKKSIAFAEAESKKVSPKCKLYLQPEWSVRDRMIPLITEYVMANPKWQISLQTHKYLNIP